MVVQFYVLYHAICSVTKHTRHTYHFVVKITFGKSFSIHLSLRFATCCENALLASLKLASVCSGVAEEKLKHMYEEACKDEDFFAPAAPEEDEMEEDGAEEGGQPEKPGVAEDPECLQFLKVLQDEQRLLQGTAEGDHPVDPTVSQKDEVVSRDLGELPDLDQVQELLTKPNVMEPFHLESSKSPKNAAKENKMPSTLLEAFEMQGRQDIFNLLFRLAVRLRSARGGIDTGFIKNARSSRKASRGLNWHQLRG